MNANSPITTHVLDTALGRPAEDLRVVLSRFDGEAWSTLGNGQTDRGGRIADLWRADAFSIGRYRLTFATGEYHVRVGMETFYPEVVIEFNVTAAQEHYHIPLLLSPFGYSTYRGS